MKINLKSIILLVILLGISAGVVYVFNQGALDVATRATEVVTPESFTGTKDIAYGDVVKISGTPDLLNAVGLEDRETKGVYSYYVPLEEYGNSFIVQIKKPQLKSEIQNFIGSVTGLTKTEYGTRIKSALNKPVELNDEDRAELDPDTIRILNDQTTNEFTSKTLLIINGETPDINAVIANIVFWIALLFTALATAFRKTIFS